MWAAISQLIALLIECVTRVAFNGGRGDDAGDGHENGADAGKARPSPGQS